MITEILFVNVFIIFGILFQDLTKDENQGIKIIVILIIIGFSLSMCSSGKITSDDGKMPFKMKGNDFADLYLERLIQTFRKLNNNADLVRDLNEFKSLSRP